MENFFFKINLNKYGEEKLQVRTENRTYINTFIMYIVIMLAMGYFLHWHGEQLDEAYQLRVQKMDEIESTIDSLKNQEALDRLIYLILEESYTSPENSLDTRLARTEKQKEQLRLFKAYIHAAMANEIRKVQPVNPDSSMIPEGKSLHEMFDILVYYKSRLPQHPPNVDDAVLDDVMDAIHCMILGNCSSMAEAPKEKLDMKVISRMNPEATLSGLSEQDLSNIERVSANRIFWGKKLEVLSYKNKIPEKIAITHFTFKGNILTFYGIIQVERDVKEYDWIIQDFIENLENDEFVSRDFPQITLEKVHADREKDVDVLRFQIKCQAREEYKKERTS